LRRGHLRLQIKAARCIGLVYLCASRLLLLMQAAARPLALSKGRRLGGSIALCYAFSAVLSGSG